MPIFAPRKRKIDNMTNETTRTITSLKAYSNQEEYADEYIFMTDNLERILCGDNSIKTDVAFFIYCRNGEIRLEMDNIPYIIHSHDLFVSLPNSIIKDVLASPGHKVEIICFSSQFVDRLNHVSRETWRAVNYLKNHPLKHFGDDDQRLFEHYSSIIRSKINKEINNYEKEILLHVASACFEEAMACILREIDLDQEPEADDTDTLRQNVIFKKFVQEVAADNGRHRSVAYYADKLCLTPKYVSTMVKRVSGKKALTLINDCAINHIKDALRHSESDVSEISDTFNFPNNSFFAKYFRHHTGMSPSEFRNNNLA